MDQNFINRFAVGFKLPTSTEGRLRTGLEVNTKQWLEQRKQTTKVLLLELITAINDFSEKLEH